jgi:Domain of unknown function (DUF5655)
VRHLWARSGLDLKPAAGENKHVPGDEGYECFHCKQWVEQGDDHDCWTTTEAALTQELPEDLRDAWDRLRDTVLEFGPQRVYASHHSIMFSKKVCYFFVRPKPRYLEVCIILGRPIRAPQVRSVMKGSRKKYANMIRITHRDEVEAPIADWLREAYDMHDTLLAKPGGRKAGPRLHRAKSRT